VFGVSWADSMWAWALCASDSVCSCTPHHLVRELVSCDVVMSCMPLSNFCIHLATFCCKLTQHQNCNCILAPLHFCLTSFPFWEAERRKTRDLPSKNCKAPIGNPAFYVKTSALLPYSSDRYSNLGMQLQPIPGEPTP
jgi:hypothetical protein